MAKTALIVEDNALNLKLMRDLLEASGIETLQTKDGTHALELAREHRPDICRQWFEELEPVDLRGGLLRVATANSVQEKYLQSKCLDQFTDAADRKSVV